MIGTHGQLHQAWRRLTDTYGPVAFASSSPGIMSALFSMFVHWHAVKCNASMLAERTCQYAACVQLRADPLEHLDEVGQIRAVEGAGADDGDALQLTDRRQQDEAVLRCAESPQLPSAIQ